MGKSLTGPCQACGTNLEFESEFQGQTATCPNCGKQIQLIPLGRIEIPADRTGLAKAAPSGAAESTILQNKNVTVTNLRFIVGSRTFPVRAISSVESVEIPPSRGGPIVLIFLGLLIGFFGFAEGTEPVGIMIDCLGLFVLTIGVAFIFTAKARFQLVLRTAGGDVMAYESKDPQDIMNVSGAINEAIVAIG